MEDKTISMDDIYPEYTTRKPTESQQDYKERMSKINKYLKHRLKGSLSYISTYYDKKTGRIFSVNPPYVKSKQTDLDAE